jgi:serine/threonine protein kinase
LRIFNKRSPSSPSSTLRTLPSQHASFPLAFVAMLICVYRYHGSFLKGSHLWIVMEYCSGGSCSDLMKPGVFREEYIAIICRELLKGLEYLHNEGKLHRDIKGQLRF